jgi:catechol 2,3-dioxygenase-like lactoylglutathione lyase family enzyme
MSKVKFTRMGHCALVVRDLSESLRFYKDVLGCTSIWESDSDWAQLGLGPDDISLIEKKDGRALHPPHVGFQVSTYEDLLKMHAQLKEQGVFVEEIRSHRDGTASFYFRDPSNNILEALWDDRNLEPARKKL